MIDLRDSTVLVNNVEEYIAVTKIAKKQGFRWVSWAPLSIVLCEFPTRLEFNRKYETYWVVVEDVHEIILNAWL